MSQPSIFKSLRTSLFLSLGLIVLVGLWLGVEAFFLVLILSILEVTLSFDNAVVNARVLERMTPAWQARFLTWGILFAVVGTRFILPIIIVSIAAWSSPFEILSLTINDPESYGLLLEKVHAPIAAFGGVFLLMVALKYFINQAKLIHWVNYVEKRLASWGHIEAIEIAIALVTLFLVSHFAHGDQASILSAGIVGLVIFIIMEGITSSLEIDPTAVAASGLTLFIYLNILDAAFSLDGVVGAFALTTDLTVIMIGLGIGAYFVRSLTLLMVRERTLAKLIYLEHGAHWAILGLASAMFINLITPVPEVVTGLIGLCFISLSYFSSRKHLVNQK